MQLLSLSSSFNSLPLLSLRPLFILIGYPPTQMWQCYPLPLLMPVKPLAVFEVDVMSEEWIWLSSRIDWHLSWIILFFWLQQTSHSFPYKLKLPIVLIKAAEECLLKSQSEGANSCFLTFTELDLQPEESPPAGHQKECMFKAHVLAWLFWPAGIFLLCESDLCGWEITLLRISPRHDVTQIQEWKKLLNWVLKAVWSFGYLHT